MLTSKQKAFVESYLGQANFNATEAALIAGYSKKTAYSIGHENLNKPEIKAEIERRLTEMVLSANEALSRLSEQAKAAYSDYLEPNGTVDLESLLADGKGHLVKSFKHTRDGFNVEFYDAQSALKVVAKHHGLLDDRLTVRLENEIDKVLDILESELDSETFDRLLNTIIDRS